jgi:hypothetical protein
VPTILDACQVAYDEAFVEHPVLSGGGPMYGEDRDAVTTADWKYIRRLVSGVEVLFDLRVDPGERHDLSAAGTVQLQES